MKSNLWSLGFFALLPLLLSPSLSLFAAGLDKNLPAEQAILQLEQRAQQANPRDQCFLYTELVSAMTDVAGKQILDGDIDHASATLKKIEHYAQLIHLGLGNDTKKLKNAQMLMHRTTYRLNEFLHEASNEDQATLQATLKELNQVQDELLMQVFKH
ncbi:hypothetical protein [Edaphobacter bradus]|uniref:hypothetical protein n=1 Tax=Edaphobacter bradus TaxID=2259016 RepID=UPI0021E05D7F|nr:hypothetical protein [Edaphobacter bradus]